MGLIICAGMRGFCCAGTKIGALRVFYGIYRWEKAFRAGTSTLFLQQKDTMWFWFIRQPFPPFRSYFCPILFSDLFL